MSISTQISVVETAIASIRVIPSYPGKKSHLEDLAIELHNLRVEYEEETFKFPRVGY